MNNTTFVYGSELQGRGYPTKTDLIVGYMTVIIGSMAFFGAFLNLYLIGKLKAFHNAFGFFWAVRSVGEIGTDITFAVYSGPVTIMQNTDISPYLAIIIYHFSYTFAYIQCVMNFIIALNRFVAVWLPLHYQRIFNKKLCIFVAVMVACQALSVITLYLIFPCQEVGYGPRFYSQVFVKCEPGIERNYSILAYILNKICFIMACCGTAAINLTTFLKIGHIRLSSNVRFNNKDFKRDVRLFSLGVVQDVLMMIIVFSIVVCNNEQDLGIIGILLSYDGLIFIYMFNTLSMVFFNPECRRFLFGGRKATVSSAYIANTGTAAQSVTGQVSVTGTSHHT
ncbi:hypothetical protein QR680_016329 [Steinernema hermaphroditum]|uniref:7TM GPCR serpentine receptor class x (Srx) domain-containing protein n=1 Tax=Steinernema hermaphroditum TaxID=289476 RepID=A0AA39HAW3_9BILA|nr:hypothetical protein QR680_016329 [Steinernema hermaphroditum]